MGVRNVDTCITEEGLSLRQIRLVLWRKGKDSMQQKWLQGGLLKSGQTLSELEGWGKWGWGVGW